MSPDPIERPFQGALKRFRAPTSRPTTVRRAGQELVGFLAIRPEWVESVVSMCLEESLDHRVTEWCTTLSTFRVGGWATDLMRRLVVEHPNIGMRAEIFQALARSDVLGSDDQTFLEGLWRESPEPVLRRARLESLSDIATGPDACVQQAAPALQDPDASVRSAAVSLISTVVSEFGPISAESVALIERVLDGRRPTADVTEPGLEQLEIARLLVSLNSGQGAAWYRTVLDRTVPSSARSVDGFDAWRQGLVGRGAGAIDRRLLVETLLRSAGYDVAGAESVFPWVALMVSDPDTDLALGAIVGMTHLVAVVELGGGRVAPEGLSALEEALAEWGTVGAKLAAVWPGAWRRPRFQADLESAAMNDTELAVLGAQHGTDRFVAALVRAWARDPKETRLQILDAVGGRATNPVSPATLSLLLRDTNPEVRLRAMALTRLPSAVSRSVTP